MGKSAELLRNEPYAQPLLLQTQVAVLQRPGQFLLRKEFLPFCSANDVTIALEGCGICASSLPVWEGREWFTYPLEFGAPGHEGWGKIVALGDEVRRHRSDLFVGQRVAALGGQAYAHHMNVPAADVIPLPQSLAGIPFPGEAIGCAMNIFRRADIVPGQTVAIIGAGFLGLLLVQLAVAAEARVLVMSRRSSALEMAKGYGAEACFDTEDWWGNAQRMLELTGGRGCERVIEATGLQFALDVATEIIGEYGRLVIAGYHQDGLRQINLQKWNWRGIDVANAHERDPRRVLSGIKEGVWATEQGIITPHELLTHSFRLHEIDQGFQMMADRPDGFIKGWITL